MNSVLRVLVIAVFSVLLACAKPKAQVFDSGGSCTPLASSGQSIGTGNVVPITVGCGYPNEPCVAVKICTPGSNPSSTTDCQIIDHILLDTGSYGLRLFNCAVSLNLPHQQVAGSDLAECVAYADNSSDWGPVALADVYLAGETTSTGAASTGIQIQIVDPNYAPTYVAKGGCGTPESNPSYSGFNGILGIGLFANDCETCTTSNNASAPSYAVCAGGDCSLPATVDAAIQVQNPIAKLVTVNSNGKKDNNGTILAINAFTGGTGGTTGMTGSLILGIDTLGNGANNDTQAGTGLGITDMYPADPSYGVTRMDYYGGAGNPANGQYPDSFVDSGSNLWDFPDGWIHECGGDLTGYGIYCPLAATTPSFTPYSGVTAKTAITFTLGNGANLTNGNSAYNNIGAYFGGLGLSGGSPDSIDMGFPFYYGRKVVTGISGKTDTVRGWGGVNTPYWAW